MSIKKILTTTKRELLKILTKDKQNVEIKKGLEQ